MQFIQPLCNRELPSVTPHRFIFLVVIFCNFSKDKGVRKYSCNALCEHEYLCCLLCNNQQIFWKQTHAHSVHWPAAFAPKVELLCSACIFFFRIFIVELLSLGALFLAFSEFFRVFGAISLVPLGKMFPFT